MTNNNKNEDNDIFIQGESTAGTTLVSLFTIIATCVIILALYAHHKAKPKIVDVITTAYCPSPYCCGRYSDGYTATGSSAYTPGVAVDPRQISYGSKITVPGYNNNLPVLADDTGRGLLGKNPVRIDVRFKTHEEAVRWGTQKLEITLER